MTATALEKVNVLPPGEVVRVAMTPMDMLEKAVASGQGIEVISKLMDLQDRWEKSQNRKAFDMAIARAKSEIPVIVKNAIGHNNKKYADFAAIARVVDPILGKHGLHYRFRTVQDDKTIRTTCVLGHDAGHSEENTLIGPADATGSKNAIQAIGSTLTYLQRYSLVQALGLAAAEDDDGKESGAGEPIDNDQLKALIALADEVGADKERFCKVMKVESFSAIAAKDFQRAVDLLNTKRKQQR
jgi:hypothetical protein